MGAKEDIMNTKQALGLVGVIALGTIGTAASFGAYGWSRDKRHSLMRSSLTAGAAALVAGVVTGIASMYVVGQTGISNTSGLGLIDVQKKSLGLLNVQSSRRNMGLINVQRGLGRW